MDTRIIQTLWHVTLVSMLTGFHCTSFTSVIDGQAYSLVIVSEFETLAILAITFVLRGGVPRLII